MDLSRTRLIDTLGLGVGLWVIGYVASLVLFFTPLKGVMGWILLVVLAPVTAYIAYRRFKSRKKALAYYAVVSVAWLAVAMVMDYVFIVKLFTQPGYYALDVFAYYAVTFLMPLLIGWKFGGK
jgi:hypothetical protein